MTLMNDLKIELFFKEIDDDILTLAHLIEELRRYNHEMNTSPNAQYFSEAEEQFYHVRDQYRSYKDYLLNRLEDWISICKEKNIPVNIGNYKVLKELREQKAKGI